MRKMIWILLAALVCLLAGCSKQAEEEKAVLPGARITRAAYRYEQAYELAEGWAFEMTVTSENQLRELKNLMNAVSLEVTEEELTVGSGYLITLFSPEGDETEELLVLDDGRISRGGMICRAEGAQALKDWLGNLRLDEQEVGN